MAEQERSRFRLPWSVPGSDVREGGGKADEWRATVRSRLVVGAVLFGIWTAAIEARLVYLQVIRHGDMMARANRQQINTVKTPAKRGEILDRHGRVLAYSVDADTIAADPSKIQDPDRAAALVCGALDGCDAENRQAMARSLRREGQFAYLARKVSPDEALRVRDLQLAGILFLKESRRFYPKRDLAAHLLGYVGLDNVGLGGLESAYDDQIRGREGELLIQIDARQHALASRVEREPTAGAALELTIDQLLQHIAERELRAGVLENRAAGGSAIIMDPHTGEVLAMANYPTFNPNIYGRYGEKSRRNRAVQDLYEPGSTFKVVTASAALEEDVVDPEDPIDVSAGMIRFGSRQIDDVHRYGILSFADVIVKSSNVGAVKVALRLGPERLGRYVSRFGFGQTVSPDFRGENPGIVWNPAKLNNSALASVAIGYQVGVTALQMATAVSSVANGGTLFEPRVVRGFVRDGRRTDIPTKTVRRTVSERTAAELTAIMESVVERGTAKLARLDGFTIAGKTGTSRKVVDGRYSRSDYNASFVGFVPSRKPALTIVVVIDSPHGPNGYYAGPVAAPIFRRIADASLRHLGIGPTINPPPPVIVARHETDAARASSRPIVDSRVTRAAIRPVRDGLMPDLSGLSAREAVRTLTSLGMTTRMNGDGFVLQQSPAAGTPVAPGEICRVTLGRQPPVDASGGVPQ